MPHPIPILLVLFLSAGLAGAADLAFRGLNDSMTDAEAIELISARLEYLKDREASDSRADDAAFLLQRLLVQRGFTEAKVDWKVPDRSTILLLVTEGKRSTLGDVNIQGMDPDLVYDASPDEEEALTGGELRQALIEQVRSAHKDRAIAVGKGTPFLREHYEAALQDALHLLQSEGFWDAKVDEGMQPRRQHDSRVDLFLRVIPGPRYILLPFEFEGAVDPELRRFGDLNRLAGRYATTSNIRKARARVEKFYLKGGFQFAKVRMLATHKDGKTQLRFEVDPGRQYRVGEISVAGTEKVKPHLVEERIHEHRGENYDVDKINRDVRELLGSGAFAGIRVEEQPRPDGFIDITLHVTEAKPEGYYLYGGAGSFEGMIIGAGYYNRNLMGNLWNLSTRAEWSGLGLLGEVSVTEPRFLGADLRFTPRAFLTTRTFEGYRKAEAGLGVELEWDVTDKYQMVASYHNSFVTLNSDGLPNSEIGPDRYGLNVLGFTQIYDDRDNPVLPKDGFFASLDTDLGLTLGSGSVSFLRGEGKVSFYKSIFEKGAIAVGARAGVIVPNGSDANLPVDLRYFLGGGNSVRSFPERELGPEASNGLPRGGEAYWVANAEYIHSIVGPVNGVLFLDAGSLNRDHHALLSGDVKYALGLGVRLDLPIGPVRLEYGHSLNPENNEPGGAFHFSIGAAF